ncbi:hypothetical protein AC578_5084 [Pseudocercospora eumusae]|uniref:Amino acid permease/ SLC12A domain-containing protein n=1 Tax=Pseudocercospora eumusae TaxID=321146 RepID=A0A139HIL9_9PEZI|nr:hypothetical protein AC578_5084 [Pseudocercospora eumusae]
MSTLLHEKLGGGQHDADTKIESNTLEPTTHVSLEALGYQAQLRRNRGLYTILFQVLAITAVPFGEGSAIFSAIYGGGQLPYFVGWIVVSVLDQCMAMSLSELASRFPTTAGPYYWSYQLANVRLGEGSRAAEVLSFITGWTWLVGNWTIALSVNFGTASFIAGTATIYHPDWSATAWELLLIFYAICLITFLVCGFGNRILPYVDAVASVWNLITILIVFIALSATAKVGRHDAATGLGGYDKSLSGWGDFSFFIGLLPAAYTFAAIGMITVMAEECHEPAVELPKALSLVVPISGIAGLFFILPICFTLPPLEDIFNAPLGQALPYIFHVVMGSRGGGLALMFFILGVAMFCSISITTAASRTTWAFARDHAIPLSRVWSKLAFNDTPIAALALTTIVQMLLGLINLGSTAAFTAFISVGVIGLAASYGIPILMSVLSAREAVSTAPFRFPSLVGWIVNIISILWIGFQLVLFSMPSAIPVTLTSMNWASVVFVGFMVLSAIYYVLFARRVYKGPPKSDGL